MPVQSASLLLGATVGLTGGTATSFVPSGKTVPDGVQTVASADTSAVTRRSITHKSRSATINQATGKFGGKDKRSTVFVFPEILPDGSISFDLVRIEVECHPQSAPTKIAALRSAGVNLLVDTDYDNFWSLGTVA